MSFPSPADVCNDGGARHLDSHKPIGGASKRLFDLVLAVLLLVLVGTLVVAVAAMILALDGRPIMIRHFRVGRGGTPFACLKFRTMVPNADQALEEHLRANPAARPEWSESRKLKNDPRVTRLGKVLRKSSLDELPQVINVFKGEMSFVGPRPIVRDEVSQYGAHIADYYRARPGLTGPWQVSGRNDVTYGNRVLLDSDYVQNWSFARDILILLKTVPAVITTRGVY
jgi:exopolysaccharide production protein ExoY